MGNWKRSLIIQLDNFKKYTKIFNGKIFFIIIGRLVLKSFNFLNVSGLCGMSLIIIFSLTLFISLQNAPWFGWTDNAISDLGRPEYEMPFFNLALGFIGILLLVFSIGLISLLRKERIGPTMLALSSIYFIGVGIFPLPDPNHVDISGLFFIAFPLGFLLIGVQLYKKKDVFIARMGKFALVIGILSIISPVVLVFYKGIAIPELIIIFPGFSWCFICGLHLFLKNNF
jgi:hypothetical membrane protein